MAYQNDGQVQVQMPPPIARAPNDDNANWPPRQEHGGLRELPPQQVHGAPQNQNNAVLIAPGDVMPPPSPFLIPTDPRYVNRQTNRVQLTVRRVEGKFHRNARIVCRAEGIQGLYSTAPLFVAEESRNGGFRIYNITNDRLEDIRALPSKRNYFAEGTKDPRFVGELHREVKPSGGYIEYKLVQEDPTRNEKKLVSTTIYSKRSLSFPVVNGLADRIAYSVVHDESVSVASRKQPIHENAHDEVPHFDSLKRPVCEHIDDDIHAIGEQHKELKVFQSKRRFTNRSGKRLHRDVEPLIPKFNGRALVSSKKNLQIMNVSSGKVILQVGRQGDTTFALDFLPPYTPFQAFGFALAQLDAN